MIKKMWLDNASNYSPFDMKKVISIFASQVKTLKFAMN